MGGWVGMWARGRKGARLGLMGLMGLMGLAGGRRGFSKGEGGVLVGLIAGREASGGGEAEGKQGRVEGHGPWACAFCGGGGHTYTGRGTMEPRPAPHAETPPPSKVLTKKTANPLAPQASERLSGLVQANLLDLELYDFFQLLGGLDGAMYLHLSAAAGADAADAPAAGGGGGPARAVAGVPAGAKRWPRCGWIGSGRRQEEEQQQEAAQVQVLQPQQLLAWSAQRVQPQPQAGAGAGAGSVAQAVSGDVSVTAADETSAGPATTTASNL